ncbi:hypothetical protein BX616_006376 [Lobosporangium transversale]|uniref:Major facilitator superfamily domain-containing protein n=1 Tax=Lobosporangium transversale TaxID=64571 RepID=A0A1Y2GCY5_9FUNG|nr:major facilitator superfamily domain-containing protein [Lobosporangium transversale]KAF9896989.1 hypothetical protein BX616_006376 [Lobosporangium transversale]ORZ06101.1 major facilitator superfamily domain-containing protein [Lobosporangium transversale]|eukprot:XP_021877370.1 major facilitator superfamily domain-containing protein [Lobosporangium transversale]
MSNPPSPSLQSSSTPTVTEITIPSPMSNKQEQLSMESRQETALERLNQKMRPFFLSVVCFAQFIDIINGASVTVAILPIATNLEFQVPQILWIVNAYTIAFGGLLLVSGRLGDLFGHRRLFLLGLFWFATWSLIVSFAVSPIMFVISRALQGVGAAITVPTAMALIATNYAAGPERTRAFSVFAAFGGLGAITGILMAGGILASIGWAWIFRVSAIIGYVLLIVAFVAIPFPPSPARKPRQEKPKMDYVGAATATMGVTGIVYYISTGVEDGWASPKTLPVLAIALVLLAAFIYTESRVESPLMPLRIWKQQAFTTSVVLGFFSMAALQGMFYNANMVFQEVYGWDALQTALGFLVHAILAVIMFSILGRILPRLRLKILILVGFLLRSVAALMFSFVDEDVSYWRLPFPAFIIHITGVAFTLLPLQITAVRDAKNQDQGLVGAIYNTGLQLGAPFGIAILNVIAISTNGQHDGGQAAGEGSVRTGLGGPGLMKGFRNAFYGIIAMGLLSFVLAMIILPWDKPSIRTQKGSSSSSSPEDNIKAVEEGQGEEQVEQEEEEEEGEKGAGGMVVKNANNADNDMLNVEGSEIEKNADKR